LTGYNLYKGVTVKKVEEHRERLAYVIENLNSLKPNSIIIVEGKTDKLVLQPLISNYIRISTIVNLNKLLMENKVHREYLILTDFDGEGKKLHKYVKNKLLGNGISENFIRDDIRNTIRKYLTLYGYGIYDGLSSLIKKANVNPEKFKVNVLSRYLYILDDE